ncbi:MAG: hypothetical protein HY267_01980 [Deltaproteobacteria bacterium]|nr:hypothetical protein [Deltaproteobacteria bacterium]
MKFEEIYFAVPWAPPLAPSTSASSNLSKTDREQLEDKIRQLIDGWTEEEQATAYLYLYASGMDLEKARKIRRRAGFVT